MANGGFRDLVEAQRETARILRGLATQLQRSPASEDFGRLVRPLSEALRRKETEADQRRSAPPAFAAGQTSGASETPAAERQSSAAASRAQIERLISAAPGSGQVERALDLTRRAIGDLGVSLSANTRVLEKATTELAGTLRGLIPGISGALTGRGGLGAFLRGGFGLVSLGLGIARLFRGNRRDEQKFLPFELPPRISIEAANTARILSGFPQVDRSQRGEIREIRVGGEPAQQPQVVVNVSAMDSQSFLDRSHDIARAVREAMLHMHPLNDVVGEV